MKRDNFFTRLNNGIKSIPTEEFAKLKSTPLFILKIEILGMSRPLWFKSKDKSKLTKKSLAAFELFGVEDNIVEIEFKTVFCKDTTKFCDENGTIDSINSFKGLLI